MDDKDKLNKVCELVHDLVMNRGMKQNVIYKMVTKYLTQQAGDNKQYVLFNDCYGGFSFSKQFQTFTNVYEERENMRDHVISFGKHLFDKYPTIARMVAFYLSDDMNAKINEAYSFHHFTKKRHYLTTNISTLEAMAPTLPPFVKNNRSYTYLYDSCYIGDIDKIFTDTGDVTVAELISKLRNDLSRAEKEIDRRKDAVDHKLVAFWNIQSQQQSSNTNKEGISFLDAVEKYGDNNEDIWANQSMLNKTAMRYLTLNPPPADIVLHEDTFETLGLLGASDKYASLKFAEVPAGLSWYIHEYDGQERVIVD